MKQSRAKRKSIKETRSKIIKPKRSIHMDGMENVNTVNEPVVITKRDEKNKGIVEIRGEQGSTGKLEIYIRQPLLADVIEKISMGNYPAADFDKAYKPCLMEHPDPKAKGRAVSRPAIYAATENFEAAADWSWETPRGVLVANPEALRQGFSIIIELTTPVPQDTLRKWGKKFDDGCKDIIAASRPFKMSWITAASESTPGKL